MSWHFLQEQEVASWEDSSLAGAPSALLSLIPIPETFSSPDSVTDALDASRSGMTSRLSTASLGADESRSSAADSLVRTSAQRAKVGALKRSDLGCGPRWPESFARFDPATFSWRTRQCSFLAGLESFSETWPRWGSMLDGECSALATLEHDTSVKGSGLSLPTIGKNEFKGSSAVRFLGSHHFRGAKMSEGLRTCESDPQYLTPDFAEALMLWPTMWTALAPLATDKFQQWRRSHGGCWAEHEQGRLPEGVPRQTGP